MDGRKSLKGVILRAPLCGANNNVFLVSFVKISWRHSFLFFDNRNSENRLGWSFWLASSIKESVPFRVLFLLLGNYVFFCANWLVFSNVSLLVLDPFYISFSIMSFQFYGIKLNWSLAKRNRAQTIFLKKKYSDLWQKGEMQCFGKPDQSLTKFCLTDLIDLVIKKWGI